LARFYEKHTHMPRTIPQIRCMTPSQIRRQRIRMRLSADKYAERLGLRGKHRQLTLYKWESGLLKPGPQTVLLMNQLHQHSTNRKSYTLPT
jgi:DNA-binding transcriptional regulator YiaG